MNRLFFLCLGICLLLACNTPVNTQKDPSPTNTKPTRLLSYSKGACFGECPMFKLEVYSDGRLSYEGIRYTEKKGLHHKQLSSTRFKHLQDKLREAKLWDKADSYTRNLSDIQKTTLRYYEEDKTKKIVMDGKEMPAALQELVETLEQTASGSGWKHAKEQKTDAKLKPHFIQDEIIVQLKGGQEVKNWIKAYQAYALRVKDKVAPSLNMWLLHFDKNKISPDKMLEQIKASKVVINAEFNKRLNQRN